MTGFQIFSIVANVGIIIADIAIIVLVLKGLRK